MGPGKWYIWVLYWEVLVTGQTWSKLGFSPAEWNVLAVPSVLFLKGATCNKGEFYRINFQAVRTDTRILLSCIIFCLFLETLSLSCLVFMCLCVCVDSDPMTQCEVCQYLCPLLWPNSIIHGIWVPLYMICSRTFSWCRDYLGLSLKCDWRTHALYTWKAEDWPSFRSDPQRSSKIFWFY